MTAQSERIYTHLKIFGTITNAQAHGNYGIRHLPSVIRDIKKIYKVPIYDWWDKGVNRFNEECRWKVYSLNAKKAS